MNVSALDIVLAFIGTLTTVATTVLAVRQARSNKQASETRQIAENNNVILQSWLSMAQELRTELGLCREHETQLRVRISALETELVAYRNVARGNWPLSALLPSERPDTANPAGE